MDDQKKEEKDPKVPLSATDSAFQAQIPFQIM